MALTPVKSSNIAAVGYDPKARTMDVQFHGGATHRYHDVPAEHHAEMMKPDASVGRYFHQHVRNAYKSKRVDE